MPQAALSVPPFFADMMVQILIDWLALLLRWTHVVAGIAWIGSSFYFVALDASLRHRPHLAEGVRGETWQVHGGGFYQMQKYLVAPAHMPPELTWFKWEAYATWIFGFALLVTSYYAEPRLYLIDPQVADLSPAMAVAIGLASLALGWLVYNALCRSVIGRNTKALAVTGFALLVAVSAAYLAVFSGRGAYIHIGALVGSIMVGNVFFVIIPNQKKVVADLLAGRTPDPALGAEAKQRSLHNNYLTLPVVFVMLSGHYAFTYAGGHALETIAGIFVMGFLVRHFFNQRHGGEAPSWWLWPAAAAVTLALVVTTSPGGLGGGEPVAFAQVQTIIDQRCRVCHSASPSFPDIAEAPKGIRFDDPAEIMRLAPQIREQAVVSRAMPLGNLTHITDAERAALAAWIAQGAKGS
jgi:uncharacterized membrane protein